MRRKIIEAEKEKYRLAEKKEADLLFEVRQYEDATAASAQEVTDLAQALQEVPLILPYIESSTDVVVPHENQQLEAHKPGNFQHRFGIT